MEKNVTKNGVAGVSIVEIMISLVLVALALIAVATVFPNMNMHRKGIHEAEQAKMLAAEALDFLQGYESCGDVEKVGDSDFNGTRDMGSTTYTVSWDVTQCGDDKDPVNIVEVSVRWSKAGKQHNIKVAGALR